MAVMGMNALLVQANAGQIPLPDESVHCVITSPPYYGLREYDAQAFTFGGKDACAHEWEFGSHSPQRHGDDGSGGCLGGGRLHQSATRIGVVEHEICAKCNAWRGQLGLEPTPELFLSHMVDIFREVRRVLRDDGTLWLNVGDSYASKNLMLMPHRLVMALQADGWWIRSTIIWHKPNAMPESVRDRPTTDFEYVFLLSKSAHYFYDSDAVREPQTGNAHSRGNGSTVPGDRNKRTVWSIPTQSYSGAHFATFPPDLVAPMVKAGTSEGGCCSSCGASYNRVVEKPDFSQQPRRSTVKAEGEMVSKGNGYLTSAGQAWQDWRNANPDRFLGWAPSCECDVGAPLPTVVLDPFAGTGTTVMVATALGRRAIGLDLSSAYLDQARERTGLAALEAWTNGIKVEDEDYDDLPLFRSLA
jgi:DNA modification methylase